MGSGVPFLVLVVDVHWSYTLKCFYKIALYCGVSSFINRQARSCVRGKNIQESRLDRGVTYYFFKRICYVYKLCKVITAKFKCTPVHKLIMV